MLKFQELREIYLKNLNLGYILIVIYMIFNFGVYTSDK